MITTAPGATKDIIAEPQPLSYFATQVGPSKHHLIEKSREIDKNFSGKEELGKELAGIGRIRNYQNYSNFLTRKFN